MHSFTTPTDARAAPEPGPGSGAQFDVVVGGTVFCDLVFSGLALPAPGAEVYAERFALTPGGVANRAVAAARLGAPTAMLASVGPDIFGARVVELLEQESCLDLRWLRRSTTVHTALTVAVADEHERSFITYQEPGAGVPGAWPGPLPAARTCHIGLGVEEVPGWVARMRAAGTTVVAGVGWDPTHVWSPTVLDRLAEVDVFVPNEIEALRYTGTETIEAAAAALAERVATVVITRGRAGALAVDSASGQRLSIPAVEVTVADPTGAGDVFVAALMAAGAHGWDLVTRVRFAALAASLSVRGLGGALSAPRAGDIRDFLRHHRPGGDFAAIADWASATATPDNRDLKEEHS